MFTKEDYMRLPKKRLAEMLVERDNPMQITYIPYNHVVPCYASDGICTNPQRDCINCPKIGNFGGIVTTTDTTITTKDSSDALNGHCDVDVRCSKS